MLRSGIPVILNPAARGTRASKNVRLIEALEPGPEVHLTRYAGEAEQLAERLVREGHPLVVAAGGDGTVNEVLQGLCRANRELPAGQRSAALGVLPLGTMNVFSLEIQQPHRGLAACWQRIVEGRKRELDLWMANDFYFIQLAGVGADAEIIRRTTWAAKRRYGPLSYVFSALRVMRAPLPLLSVQVAGEKPRLGTLVLIGNGKHYGGPFPLFEGAVADDGLLDFLVFHSVGPWELTQLARRLMTSSYSPSEDFEMFQARDVVIDVAEPGGRAIPFELDGELRGETPVRLRAADRRLTVIG